MLQLYISKCIDHKGTLVHVIVIHDSSRIHNMVHVIFYFIFWLSGCVIPTLVVSHAVTSSTSNSGWIVLCSSPKGFSNFGGGIHHLPLSFKTFSVPFFFYMMQACLSLLAVTNLMILADDNLDLYTHDQYFYQFFW